MVLDSSAVVAVLLHEPERRAFLRLMASAPDPVISVAGVLECSIVMHRRSGLAGLAKLDHLLAAHGVRKLSVDAAQALAARRAWLRFGKGRAAAGLNFGDCFSYALAQTVDRPLLFKGRYFSRTDIAVAGR